MIFVNLVFSRWKKLGFCALSDKRGNLGYDIFVGGASLRLTQTP